MKSQGLWGYAIFIIDLRGLGDHSPAVSKSVSKPAGKKASHKGGAGSSSKEGNETDDLPFDELLTNLQKVVGKLETGDLSLEQSLSAYEEGISLAKRGHGLLDSAEKKVEVLLENGETRTMADKSSDETP